MRYQWLFEGRPIADATEPSLTLTNVETSAIGGYAVRVTDSEEAAITSREAFLSLPVPVIVLGPQPTSVLEGAAVELSVEILGPQTATYQWYFGGSAIPDATNQTLRLPESTRFDSGAYSVMVSTPYGTALSSATTVTVHAAHSMNT